MSSPQHDATGMDFALGAPLSDVLDGGVLAGRVGEQSVLTCVSS